MTAVVNTRTGNRLQLVLRRWQARGQLTTPICSSGLFSHMVEAKPPGALTSWSRAWIKCVGESTCVSTYGAAPGDWSASSEIERVLRDLFQRGVLLSRLAEVREYLTRHPDLAGALPAFCATAQTRLGKDTQLSLEVYSDPEIVDEYLVVYARRPDYDLDMLELLENISGQYRSDLARRSGSLLLTTDFASPR